MKRSVTILFFLAISQVVFAQSGNDSLRQVISRLDNIVFTAYNNRDTAVFKQYFSADLEFYHDKGGLTGLRHSVDFLKSLQEAGSDLRRELVASSLQVYPVPGYGAMQTGRHRFTHTENGKLSIGEFAFLHVWQYKDGAWKITRVMSYDH